MPRRILTVCRVLKDAVEEEVLNSDQSPPRSIMHRTCLKHTGRIKNSPHPLFVPRVSLAVFVLPQLLVAQLPGFAAQPAGLRINEFMASNVSINPDNADFDDYSDWIELHNPTTTPISLNGYHLTDNLTAPVKWPLPAGTTIPANGYLMIRADDADAGPGETFVREFSPWDTFTTIRQHANFKLSAEGEAVGLFRFEGEIQSISLVPQGADWRYLDDGTDPGALWSQATFADDGWTHGPAELGYGDGDEATAISFGSDPLKNIPPTISEGNLSSTIPLRSHKSSCDSWRTMAPSST